MAYVDQEGKNHTIFVTNHDSAAEAAFWAGKPADYIAKDAIYGVLQELEEKGVDINEVHNNFIQDRIKELYNFEENPKTISAYKSQYKKSSQFRPGGLTSNKEELAKVIKANRLLEPVLSRLIKELACDKETIKSIVDIMLNDLGADILDDY